MTNFLETRKQVKNFRARLYSLHGFYVVITNKLKPCTTAGACTASTHACVILMHHNIFIHNENILPKSYPSLQIFFIKKIMKNIWKFKTKNICTNIIKQNTLILKYSQNWLEYTMDYHHHKQPPPKSCSLLTLHSLPIRAKILNTSFHTFYYHAKLMVVVISALFTNKMMAKWWNKTRKNYTS